MKLVKYEESPMAGGSASVSKHLWALWSNGEDYYTWGGGQHHTILASHVMSAILWI